MRLSEAVLAKIGRQTLLAGLTFATAQMVETLNQLKGDLGQQPDLEMTDGIIEAEPARRGRPPGSGTQRITGVKRVYQGMAERRALVKQAGIVLRGSPSEADAEQARKILAKRGIKVEGVKADAGPPVKTGMTLRSQNLAIVKLAGLRYKGSPNREMIAKARKLLVKRGTVLPPELVAVPVVRRSPPRPPMSDAMKDKLRTHTAQRWSKITEAGLLAEAGGKLPSNQLVAKAEKLLKNRAKRDGLRQALSQELQEAVVS